MDPWQVDGEESTSIDSGALCVEVPAGTSNPWDVNVHLDGLELQAGPYALKFDASGTGGPMRALVGLGAAPYTVYGEMAETPGANAPYELFFNLAAPSDNAQIAFQIGGSSSAWTFCIDNVSLLSGGAAPTYAPETGRACESTSTGTGLLGPSTLRWSLTPPTASHGNSTMPLRRPSHREPLRLLGTMHRPGYRSTTSTSRRSPVRAHSRWSRMARKATHS